MIGDGQPMYTVYRGRRPTGEIYSPELAAQHPARDWILTRILWLCGRETGKNRGPGSILFAASYTFTAHLIPSLWACRFPMAAFVCATRM